MVRKSTLPRVTNNPRPSPSKRCGCPACLRRHPGGRPPTDDHIGSWEGRFTDPSGRVRSLFRPTWDEANAALEQTRTEIRQRRWIDPARGGITLCAWHKLWWPSQQPRLEENTEDRDLRSWRNHVEPAFGSWQLFDLTWLDIQNWVNSIWDGNGGPLAASSVVKAFQVLDRMLEAAKLDRRLPYNPADGVKLPTIKKQHPEDRRGPSYAQLRRVRRCLPKHMRVVQIVAQETGLRWGEIAGLRGCNVDLVGRRIQVREVLIEQGGRIKRKAYPKSDAGLRTVPLTARAWGVLRHHMQNDPPSLNRSDPDSDGLCEAELVFRGRNSVRRGSKMNGGPGEPYRAPLRRTTYYRQWIKSIQDAGIARVRKKKIKVEVIDPETGRKTMEEKVKQQWWPEFHDQRHTYASRLHDRGVPEAVAQEVLGHERAGEVTWQYTHAAADYAGQVLAALEDRQVDGRRLRLVA
ncbi:tyrosine-type recombinase/integrase [Streptomyces sp. NPDC048288]|uniref:tyrosine-type recombinase/integrase n=1 Tax=Streptomyces sp. NPDC048288 TaxID=3365529 RepID=UPI00371856AB